MCNVDKLTRCNDGCSIFTSLLSTQIPLYATDGQLLSLNYNNASDRC